MLVRPITMKPARRSRATAGASASAGAESSSAREPARVTCPLMSNRSLIETGIPAKGDGAAFTSRSRSIASAASIAASASTWRKARAPSPELSAMRARHSSTSLRALVRPFSRSSANDASVGVFGIVLSLVFGLFVARSWLDLQIEQRGAQGFAMGIERQRSRYATAERAGHHKIKRGNVGQLIAHDLAFDNAGKMRFDPRAGDLRKQQRIVLFVVCDHRDVGGVALVAGAGMGDLAQLHRLHSHEMDLRPGEFARQQDRRHRDHIACRLENAPAGSGAIGVERFDLVADPDSLTQVFGAAGDANAHLVGLIGARGKVGAVQRIDADQVEPQFTCGNAG